MKNKTKLFGILAMFLFMGAVALSSCGDDDKDEASCLDKQMKYMDELTAAANKYGKNPTVANCKAYRKAFETYIKKTKDCPGAMPKTYQTLYENIDCE